MPEQSYNMQQTLDKVPGSTIKIKSKKQDVFRILFLSMVTFGLIVGAVLPALIKIYFEDVLTITNKVRL